MNNFVGEENDSGEKESNYSKIVAGYTTAESVQISTQKAAEKFAKPANYTGNRSLYDSSVAKRHAKTELFRDRATVRDPYTGETLVMTKNEATKLYGNDWQKHLAESDHIKPLEKIVEKSKGNPWLTTDDIQAAANSDDNLVVTSRKYNNAKRSRTNEEFVADEKYREDKGVPLSEKGKQEAVNAGKEAEASINQQLEKSALKNMAETGHKAGKQAAKEAAGVTAVMLGIQNFIAVIKGDKDAGEAVVDTLSGTGKSAVTSYAMGNGLTVISNTLSNSSSKFIQALIKSNVPGKIVTAIMVTGNTLKRYGTGEITAGECLTELGESGIGLITTGYSMAVGQALIPIPVVGLAVGAFVGSVLTGQYYHRLIDSLKAKEMEHQERLRIIDECKSAAEQANAYRKELESYLAAYFQEYHDCFDEALTQIQFAFQTGDVDGIVSGANQITRKLGGKVYYESMEEFEDFLDDESVFVL